MSIKITSYHDCFLGVEVCKGVAVLLHVLVVLGHCQADQPQEVDQQEGPVDRHQKELEPRANQRYYCHQQQVLPKAKLVDRSKYWPVSFCAFEDRPALF